MRDHQQAEAEFKLLKAAMTELEGCRYGLWTNGLEFFFFEKEETRFDVRFRPIGPHMGCQPGGPRGPEALHG